MRLLLITNDYPPKPGGIQQYLGNVIDAYPDEWQVIAPADEAAVPDDRVSRNGSTFMWPTPQVAAWVEARAIALIRTSSSSALRTRCPSSGRRCVSGSVPRTVCSATELK